MRRLSVAIFFGDIVDQPSGRSCNVTQMYGDVKARIRQAGRHRFAHGRVPKSEESIMAAEQSLPNLDSPIPPEAYGAAEVCVYGEVPGIKQPFWNVEPVPV